MQSEDIEILNTLEALAEVNSMLRFHRQQSEPSVNSIENYLLLKADLLAQLNELLDELKLGILVLERPNTSFSTV